MTTPPKFTKSSGNIFADLELPNAEELLLKGQITLAIEDAIKRKKLTQVKAASLTGVAQPDLSNLLRGRFKGFSVERLMLMLAALGRDIEITSRPVPRSRKVGVVKFKSEAA